MTCATPAAAVPLPVLPAASGAKAPGDVPPGVFTHALALSLAGERTTDQPGQPVVPQPGGASEPPDPAAGPPGSHSPAHPADPSALPAATPAAPSPAADAPVPPPAAARPTQITSPPPPAGADGGPAPETPDQTPAPTPPAGPDPRQKAPSDRHAASHAAGRSRRGDRADATQSASGAVSAVPPAIAAVAVAAPTDPRPANDDRPPPAAGVSPNKPVPPGPALLEQHAAATPDPTDKPDAAPVGKLTSRPSIRPKTMPAADAAPAKDSSPISESDPSTVSIPATTHTLVPGTPAAAAQASRPAAHPATAQSPAAQLAPALVSLAATSNGTQRLTVRLEPAELGRVEIRVDRQAGAPARVEITVQRPETLALLVHDRPQLQQALSHAGLPAAGGSLTLHLAPPPPTAAAHGASPSSASGAGAGGHGGGSNPGGGQPPGHSFRWDMAPDQDAPDAAPPIVPRWLRAGLDITA